MNWILLAVVIGLAAWLVLTWWNGPESKTFKSVVQDAFRDGAEIVAPVTRRVGCVTTRLWAFWAPRLTNRAMLATVFADFAIVASGQDVWAWLAAHPVMAGGIVLMNLLTPLTPVGAPSRIPAPSAFPNGGLVNNTATA